LDGAFATSFSLAATGRAGDVPTATVAVTAQQVKRTVGSNTFCWDLTTNAACQP
jgi:hypothetical protein